MAAGILLHFSTKVHFSFHSGNEVYCCTIVGKTGSKSSWARNVVIHYCMRLTGGEMTFYGVLLRKVSWDYYYHFMGFLNRIFMGNILISAMFSALLIFFSITFQSTASANIPNYILNCPGRKQFFYLKFEKKKKKSEMSNFSKPNCCRNWFG